MEDKETTVPKEPVNKPVYDVVIVLGGNIRPTNRGWVTTSFVEGKEKSIGAHTRTIAATQLYQEGLASNFIVSTGRTTPDITAPTEAEVMKAEMIRYGIPAEKIILGDTSLNTMGNTQESAKIVRNKNFRRIAVLTSAWHLPRTRILFEPITKSLEKEGREVKFISAERILIRRSKKYAGIIEQVYSTETMRRRLTREAEGIKAFQAGRYTPKPGDKN